MLNDILQNNDWFTNKELESIISYRDKLDIIEGSFKSKFQETLIKTRTGECKSSNLTDIINETMIKIPSIELAYEEQLSMVKKRLEITQFLNLSNVDIIGKSDSPKSVMGDQVILYLPTDAEDSVEKTDHILLFKRLAKDNPSTILQVVLTSFHKVNFTVPVLKKYKDGKVIVENLFKQEGEMMKKCIIKVPNAAINTNKQKSKQRVALKIRCPMSYLQDCHMEQVMWEHDRCKGGISYGVDDKMMYCECGSFNPELVKFRCDDPNHGMEFCRLNDKSKEEIGELKMKEITNILILGESGVGKSTWINSIAKYLVHETLDKAMA